MEAEPRQLPLDQRQFTVRLEWGRRGAAAISQGAGYTVIVDVLSFTTAVSVALDQHAEVFPYPWLDESARAFARQHGAILATGRAEAAASAYRSDPPQISLSPASIRAVPGLDRIVLPSPNGSALASALAGTGSRILAGCLRNRTAVARWLAAGLGTAASPAAPASPAVSASPATPASPAIAVIAAGEHWPDGTLRPAAEDLWGAGAIIAALDSLGVTGLSPEARSAAAAWRAIEPELGAALASCSSGAELASAGFSGDVTIAAELDSSSCVPELTGLRFTDAGRIP